MIYELYEKMEFIQCWLGFCREFNRPFHITENATLINSNTVELYGEYIYDENEFVITQILIECDMLWLDVYNQELQVDFDLLCCE